MKIPPEPLNILRGLHIARPGKYIRLFRGKRFVIKCGGSLLEHPQTREGVLDDVALLALAGIRPILVHGGSVQADRELELAGIPCRRVKGLRVTCDRTLRVVERCFGHINGATVAGLRNRGVEAAGFSGKNGGLILAEKMLVDNEDIGHVGAVTAVASGKLDSLDDRAVPVVSSLGVDAGGNTLNVNADYVAAGIAHAVNAEKLILLTDVPGILLDPADDSSLVSTLKVKDAEKMIKDRVINSGMIPKVESAVEAVGKGLPKVHLISGKKPHSLLYEIFTDEGCGTQIIP
ncbi:MAG: acetylglutamate kinase [bacterium]